MGDLRSAKEKITAAQSTYESIADPEIRIEMQHINGWIDFSLGNLHQAESWYSESLRLAAERDRAFGQSTPIIFWAASIASGVRKAAA
ncbi:MAG: hypothetical protein R2911_33120 [Caldilineaceae bacterium]